MRAKEGSTFYVYILLDPRKPGPYFYGFNDSTIEFSHEPYYVGKGKGKRWSHHFYDRDKEETTNLLKYRKIKKLKALGYPPMVTFIFSGPDENLAYEVEEETIKAIGRYSKGQGPLLNVTEGRGMTGAAGFTLSDEAKKKISAKHKGKTIKESTKEKLRKFVGENHAGYQVPKSPEFVSMLKLANIKARYVILCPNGDLVTVFNASEFCRQHNLSDSHLYGTFTGKRSHHKGYKIIEKFLLPDKWQFTYFYDEYLNLGGQDVRHMLCTEEVSYAA